ncbi:MAG: hypothetical protein KFF73_02195 [Cyclobacteriaceae bacterium]|nr:hypothetical protein [Cyclobacteriaceae bacterium]
MKYTPLFTIEIEHDYFSESRIQQLRIVPTTNTQGILEGSGLIAKFLHNKLYVLVRHLDENKPLLNLSNDFVLQFFLEVTGPEFTEITNLNVRDPYNQKLYLSNTNSILDGNDKSVDNTLYLNEKLPQFNAANVYQYNDLVRSGSGIAYECLKKIDAGTGNLNNSSQFRKLEKVSYISLTTVLEFTGPQKVVSLNVPSPAVDIHYFQYNPVTKAFDIEVKSIKIGSSENPTNADVHSVLINFYGQDNSPLTEGIYRVLINMQEEYFYFRLENDWQACLGLINIHNDSMATVESSRILKEDGSFYMVAPANKEIETRNFKIRFAPAQYLLKYVCKTNKVTQITDDNGIIEFDNLGSNVFQSKLPVRLNEKAVDTILVTYDGSDILNKTKIPGHRFLSISDDENKYIISETFLNL